MEYTGEDIFDEIASIRDPEKPMYSLAQLNVVAKERCFVDYVLPVQASSSSALTCLPPATCLNRLPSNLRRPKPLAHVKVILLPTVPHCHLMHLICLSVIARLRDTLPVTTTWKIHITLCPQSHLQQDDIEKQAADKERVAAALENPQLVKEVNKLINPYADS